MQIITHVLTSPQSELREDTEEAAARREAARQNIGVKVTDVQNSDHESLVGEGGVVTIAVDDALSTTSENSVQNKVVTAALEGKVDVESGKGLSTEDYTTAEKTKLGTIASNAQVNVIESVEVAGNALVITGKAVNIPDADVSVKGVVRLTSDPTSEAEHTAATPEAIRRALANFGGFMVVTLDPVTKQPDVDSPSTKYIYLTKEDPSAKKDPYTEWIWIEPELGEPYWDVIGEASVDLSGYVQKVSGATEGNLGSLAADGGLVDSGISGSSVSDAVSKKHSHANGNVLDLVEEPYTTAEKTKLSEIASGAQVNVIESITAGGTALPISSKTVNISVMTGATAQASGAIGLVPQPLSADVDKFLRGDGTWQVASMNEASESDIDELFDTAGTVRIGGRLYKTITMDNQEWLAENLDYKFEYNGAQIPVGGSGTPYTPAAWYYSNNEESYGIDGTYKCGLLYNGYAVDYLEANKATLLPSGWHVPSKSEWETMQEHIGGTSVGGTKLKAIPGSLDGNWPSERWGGTDDYEFTAYPGGEMWGGDFHDIDIAAQFWTTTVSTGSYVYGYMLLETSPAVTLITSQKTGANYIRLVKTLS